MHAASDARLVIKHHPHDRGHRDYSAYIRALGARYACGERLVYVHDVHLPTLLKHARGTITMNSTVGASSMYHHTPVKALGRAIYDIPGLTSTRSLADFLEDPGELDVELYAVFCRWLRDHNQLNGSFYKPLALFDSRSGIQIPGTHPWPEVTESTRGADVAVRE
jgi:capsule polysaccharide modification protein KpsS